MRLVLFVELLLGMVRGDFSGAAAGECEGFGGGACGEIAGELEQSAAALIQGGTAAAGEIEDPVGGLAGAGVSQGAGGDGDGACLDGFRGAEAAGWKQEAFRR